VVHQDIPELTESAPAGPRKNARSRTSTLVYSLLGRADPIRLDAFRVVFAGSLLLYLHAWWQEPYEWLTQVGFHISRASSPFATAPLLPVAALPLFGLLMFGAVGALLFGWRLPLSTLMVLAFVVYVTFADIAAAFTMNKIFIAGLAVLAVAPTGAYFRVGATQSAPGQSVWPIRILQATLLVQYATAGWCKVLHGTWLDDPLTLFSQAQGQYRTDLCSWMLRSLPLGAWTLMQHSALAFELLAPVLFAVRRLRPLAFAWGGTFQVGTALMMKDLIYFSLQMVSFYLLFVDDAWLHALRLRATRALPPRFR
jgi:hypothetical protein